MNCQPKTMLKTAVGLGTIVAAAYFALPDARAFLLASTPIMLALICPLTMIVMMWMMKGTGSVQKGEVVSAATTIAPASKSDVAPNKA